MMDQPKMIELVRAAKEFVRGTAMTQLEGHAAFHARVTANALAIGRSAEARLRAGAGGFRPARG